MVLLVHFKNSVQTRVIALLNGPLVKTLKPVKQCYRPCLSVHSVLVLSRRSLVDTSGTPPGRAAGFSVPGWWVVGGGGVPGYGGVMVVMGNGVMGTG